MVQLAVQIIIKGETRNNYQEFEERIRETRANERNDPHLLFSICLLLLSLMTNYQFKFYNLININYITLISF